MNSTIQSIKSAFRHPDLGLVILRAALGVIFIIAGYNKFMGGEATLHAVGLNINYIGMDIEPNSISSLFFGSLAAGVEVAGGLGLLAGLLFRTSAFFLFLTMVVATLMKMDTATNGINDFGYPLVMALVSLGLLFIGPGKICVQKD
ncbi:MAG: DoxX family protein [Oceanipulchritudo sp.]